MAGGTRIERRFVWILTQVLSGHITRTGQTMLSEENNIIPKEKNRADNGIQTANLYNDLEPLSN
jgi:hypothetical protein